ncbi:MAG: hypothetical protein QG655_3490 [Actinomycetota bacterium]|nr:hypothetical protein [Actinomycetota bacterium]HPX37364.1 hypothetical protein [Mycobacterium sp.]
MSSTSSVPAVALDSAAAALDAEGLRAYADRLEQHGRHDHASLEELRRAAGPIYHAFIDAKQAEGQARTAAYARAAATARSMADKLDNTRRTLETSDADAGAAIQSITGSA